jgi:uncharacterized protein YaiI (UPF0178 family)
LRGAGTFDALAAAAMTSLTEPKGSMLRIFIDADACPVKSECYKVAKRHDLITTVVANQWMNMPDDPRIRLEVVSDGFDAADHWIVEHAGRGDIVVTDDIPLAARCLAKGARVLTGRGQIRDQDSIGDTMANRGLMQYLREAGAISGGQKPIDARDRGEFLQALDKLINSVKKHGC